MHTNSLERRIGNNAKSWMAKSINANTDVSFRNRDASTTDADMAAFMDNTAVNLR